MKKRVTRKFIQCSKLGLGQLGLPGWVHWGQPLFFFLVLFFFGDKQILEIFGNCFFSANSTNFVTKFGKIRAQISEPQNWGEKIWFSLGVRFLKKRILNNFFGCFGIRWVFILFCFFNFLISKIWQNLQNFRKIARIYTRRTYIWLN